MLNDRADETEAKNVNTYNSGLDCNEQLSIKNYLHKFRVLLNYESVSSELFRKI